MKYNYGLIVLICLLYSQIILSIDFQKVTIPEAECGNGADYVVYIKKNSDKKLIIEFMG